MRWLTALFMLVLCHGTVVAQASVGGSDFAKPGYSALTGLCKSADQRDMMLIKGYLIFKGGYIFGRIERLDDLLFVLHQNVSHSVNESRMSTSVPFLLYTSDNGGEKLSFFRWLGGSHAFDCDFSATPYSDLLK